LGGASDCARIGQKTKTTKNHDGRVTTALVSRIAAPNPCNGRV
jgi:hypothetical protein